MASFACLYYHLVFATKGREPLVTPEIAPRLWSYIGGIIRSQGGLALAIGGTADHVHLLASLPKNRTIPDLLREIKANSSRWVHETFPHPRFAWQDGYAAFTVSVRGLPQVNAYIAGQEEHHAKVSFEDEFRSFLAEHGVEYDERYLWGKDCRPSGA
ncbi:MAG: IS200/IS605 family transposase [Armatimonadetes bacterium]|nr:IS200/IS605 family transposase [Armatimonadota bacterium]